MAVHVEEMSSEVSVFDGSLPLSQEQIEQLVKIIMQRMEQKQHQARRNQEETSMRSSVIPRGPGRGR